MDVADEIFAQPVGVRRFAGEFLAAFPDLHHTIEDVIAEEGAKSWYVSRHAARIPGPGAIIRHQENPSTTLASRWRVW